MEAVASEGAPGDRIAVRRRILNLRFVGQDEALPIEGEPLAEIFEAFAAAYREIYGYAPEGRAIELESIRVVASSERQEMPEPSAGPVEERTAEPSGTRRSWLAGAWREVPVFDRGVLRSGDVFRGPALVFESHSATVVAEGWRGRVDGAGNLVLAGDLDGLAIDFP
jgi:5-oxoprolinase (ATP-hydrolysing)